MGYIENIYVAKEHRKKGYGRQLLDFSVEHCKKQGFNILQLDVSIHHKAALSLYESEGFTFANYRMEKIIP